MHGGGGHDDQLVTWPKCCVCCVHVTQRHDPIEIQYVIPQRCTNIRALRRAYWQRIQIVFVLLVLGALSVCMPHSIRRSHRGYWLCANRTRQNKSLVGPRTTPSAIADAQIDDGNDDNNITAIVHSALATKYKNDHDAYADNDDDGDADWRLLLLRKRRAHASTYGGGNGGGGVTPRRFGRPNYSLST